MLGLCRPGRSSLLALVVVAAACGSSANTETDAGPCWPEELATPGGEVHLGVFNREFTQLSEGQDLNIVQGFQGGYHFPLMSRIEGMEPGNPLDATEGGNPRTRYTLFELDGTLITEKANCPTRLGYVTQNRVMEIKYYMPTLFPMDRVADYYNTQVRILVEVIDRDLKYASDEAVVFALEPVADAGPTQRLH